MTAPDAITAAAGCPVVRARRKTSDRHRRTLIALGMRAGDRADFDAMLALTRRAATLKAQRARALQALAAIRGRYGRRDLASLPQRWPRILELQRQRRAARRAQA